MKMEMVQDESLNDTRGSTGACSTTKQTQTEEGSLTQLMNGCCPIERTPRLRKQAPGIALSPVPQSAEVRKGFSEQKQPESKSRAHQFLIRYRSYYSLHFLYFLTVSFIGGLVLYATEYRRGIRFIDTYFTSVSAMCETGLTTVNFAEFSIAGQITTLMLISLGSFVLASAYPQIVRWYRYASYAKVRLGLTVKYFRHSAVLDFLSSEALLVLVPSYSILFQLFGFLVLTVYFAANSVARSILQAERINYIWFSLFNSISAFNNSGFSLMETSLISFDRDPFVLLVHALLIAAGNTAFPVFLRAFVWLLKSLVSRTNLSTPGVRNLLDNPRSCFTHLFTTDITLKLFYIIAGTTVVETVLSLILDYNHLGRAGTGAGHKVVDAFFQAVSTRTAGFLVTDMG